MKPKNLMLLGARPSFPKPKTSHTEELEAAVLWGSSRLLGDEFFFVESIFVGVKKKKKTCDCFVLGDFGI